MKQKDKIYLGEMNFQPQNVAQENQIMAKRIGNEKKNETQTQYKSRREGRYKDQVGGRKANENFKKKSERYY